MIANIVNVDSFKSIFNTIEGMFENIVFECDSEHIFFSALDKSHSVYMSCEMTEDYFVEYDCPTPDKFCVDISEMKKCLKSVKGELIIESTDYSVILKSSRKQFTLHQIDIDYNESKKPPNIPYTWSIPLAHKELKETAKDMSTFANQFDIITTADSVIFKTDGTIGQYQNSFESFKTLDNSKTHLSLEKFLNCLGTDKVSKEVVLKGGNSLPVGIEQEDEGICVKYMIAPIIEEED